MNPSDFISWYGIGFLAVFVIGMVMLLISLLGLGGDSDADMAADGDADIDADANVDGNAEGDVHADADHVSSIMDFLGIGRCPLSIIIMSMCFLFTLLGIGTIIIMRLVHLPGLLVGCVAYPSALAGSFILTGFVARGIGKVMPTSETFVESEASLVGSIGIAVYTFQNGEGFVQVRDTSGTLQEVKAHIDSDCIAVMSEDVVVLVDYDAESKVFQVERAPVELARKRG